MTATVMRLMTATVRLLQSFKNKILKLSITEIIKNTVTIVYLNLSNGLQKFIDICMKTLDKCAPRKKKCSRGNNMPFMNK